MDLDEQMGAWDGGEPKSPQDADRLLWGIRREQRKIDAAKTQAAEAISEVAAWMNQECAAPQNEIDRRNAALEQWARANHRLDENQVTWRRPLGTIKLTAAKYSIRVTDHEAAAKQVEDMDEGHLVRRTPEVLGGELKKLFDGKTARPEADLWLDGEHEEGGGEHDPDFAHYRMVLEETIIPGAELVIPRQRAFKVLPPAKDGADSEDE